MMMLLLLRPAAARFSYRVIENRAALKDQRYHPA
jgi:hypothetical protein